MRTLAFLPDERLCVVSGNERTVQLRRLRGQLVREPPEPITGVFAIATSKDGDWVVTGTTDGFATWNLVQNRIERYLIGGVRAIDISSDSKWVITGSDDYTADVWDLSTGERHPGLGPLRHDYCVMGVKFCPCGKRVATAAHLGFIQIYATSSGQKLFTIPTIVSSSFVSNFTFAWSALSPRVFAVSQGQIKCLNSNDGSLVSWWSIDVSNGHSSHVALSPNSKIIAYSVNNNILLRDTVTCKQVGDILEDVEDVSCITFSSGGDRLVAARVDAKPIVWDLRKLLSDTSYFIEVGTFYLCVFT